MSQAPGHLPKNEFIVLAPFANERIREWPIENFIRLIELGLEDGYRFVISGARAQRPLANQIARPFPSYAVDNACGATSWPQLQQLINDASFIVANNSGIAHQSAAMGKWVLCVFSGSHSWIEWMPRGPRVVTLTNMPPCSPCISPVCYNDLTCLRAISPEIAYDAIHNAIFEKRDRLSAL